MPKVIDEPCPTHPEARKPRGTLWVHNPQMNAWYACNRCPYCHEVHEPQDIRKDRLMIPVLGNTRTL